MQLLRYWFMRDLSEICNIWSPWIKCNEQRRWIQSHDGGVTLATPVGYHEYDGGYRARTVEYHEQQGWCIMSQNSEYRVTTVAIQWNDSNLTNLRKSS